MAGDRENAALNGASNGVEKEDTRKIFGLPRRTFFILAAVIAVLVVSICIAVPVALSKNGSSSAITEAQPASQNKDVNKDVDGKATTRTTTPTPTAPPPPPPTAVPMALCDCPTVYMAGQCYTNLTVAVLAATDGAVLQIARSLNVTEEIALNKTISLKGMGKKCNNGTKAEVKVNMNSPVGGVFVLLGNKITLGLSDLIFTRDQKSGPAAVARSPELPPKENVIDTKETKKVQSLRVEHCEFYNFRTKGRGGSVFFIEKVDFVQITDSVFDGNDVALDKELYDGSGAVWIRTVPDKAKVVVENTVFSNNKHLFYHGLGAGLGFFEVYGRVSVQGCEFQNNECSGGAGLYVDVVAVGASVEIDGNFEDNKAVLLNGADESRGGAIWLKDIFGSVSISGSFTGNQCAAGRGAAIANNRLTDGGSVTVSAYFGANKCLKGSTVWDTLQGFNGATITFEGCEANENVCETCDPKSTAVRLRRPVKDLNGNAVREMPTLYATEGDLGGTLRLS